LAGTASLVNITIEGRKKGGNSGASATCGFGIAAVSS
jgi:hypothetical protein